MSKKQSGKKQSQGTYNPKDLAASAAFVEKASQPFADVTRLEPDEKRRMLRSKRGAREVIAMIADLAVKYGVVAPGVTPDTMTAMSNQARALEPLLATVSALYELVRDEHLRAQTQSWKMATVTYGILKKSATTDRAMFEDLEPVRRWFQAAVNAKSGSATRKGKGAPAPAAPVAPASPAAATDTTIAPAIVRITHG